MARIVQLGLIIFGVLIVVTGMKYDRWKDDFLEDEDVMDVSDFSVYYNTKTNESLNKMMPRPWYTPTWFLRLPFYGGPCQCEGVTCKCCAGIKINRFQFNREACTKLTYDPPEGLINMEVTMNDDRLYKNSFSVANPPPFCVPIPVPYMPPGFFDMCVRLYDITLMNQRLHVCMDWDTRIDKAPVLVLHYDCMDLSPNGVSLSKPGAAETAIDNEMTQLNSDVYDPVNETIPQSTPYPFKNVIKYI